MQTEETRLHEDTQGAVSSEPWGPRNRSWLMGAALSILSTAHHGGHLPAELQTLPQNPDLHPAHSGGWRVARKGLLTKLVWEENLIIVFSSLFFFFFKFFTTSSPGECVWVLTLDSHVGPGEQSSGVRVSRVPGLQPHGPTRVLLWASCLTFQRGSG